MRYIAPTCKRNPNKLICLASWLGFEECSYYLISCAIMRAVVRAASRWRKRLYMLWHCPGISGRPQRRCAFALQDSSLHPAAQSAAWLRFQELPAVWLPREPIALHAHRVGFAGIAPGPGSKGKIYIGGDDSSDQRGEDHTPFLFEQEPRWSVT